MVNKIDANAVYLLETYDQKSEEIQMYNPIASKVNAVEEKDDKRLWGIVNWYDPANQQFHVIEAKSKPKIEGKDIKVIDIDNVLHKFVFVTAKIFNSKVKDFYQDAPNLNSDGAVPTFLKIQI